jgi:hypothetical protein
MMIESADLIEMVAWKVHLINEHNSL